MEQATIERLNEGRAKLSHDPERPLPFRIVRDRLLPILGDYTPTEEALRLLHNGTTKRADPLPGAGAGVWMGTASLLAAVAAPPPRDVPVPSRSGRRRIDDHQVEVRVA